MRLLLGISFGFVVSFATWSIGADCERLPPPHPVSYLGQESKLFDRLIEITQHNYSEPPGTLAVVETVVACLEVARERVRRDGAESPFASLAQVTIELSDSATEITASSSGTTPRRFAVKGKLPKLASRTVKALATDSRTSEQPVPAEQIWFLWFHSYMTATGSRYNWYDYADELTEEKATDRGRSFRVGFDLEVIDERPIIGSILDSALSDAGLEPGTELVGFDDRMVFDLTLPEFQRFWFSSEPFSYVVTVSATPQPLRIFGESIPTRHTTLSWAVQEKIGYVRIYRFARDTLIEMRRAMRRLEKEGILGLIVDVRGNPGGALSPGLIDIFFKPDQTVVSYRDHDSDEARDVEATVEYHDLPVAIIVDHESASMSETLAAAFVIHDRGPVIGEVTAGKGVGQRVFPVLDEGRVHLVGRTYFYPGTRDTWDGEGIQPNVEIEIDDESKERLETFLASPVPRLDQQRPVDRALRTAEQHLKE